MVVATTTAIRAVSGEAVVVARMHQTAIKPNISGAVTEAGVNVLSPPTAINPNRSGGNRVVGGN